MNSILDNEKHCFICGTTYNLHKHHIYEGTGRRQLSEREGCWCYLCARHHNMSNMSVHYNKKMELYLKTICETKWMEYNHKGVDDFIKIFGKNYLDDPEEREDT